LVPLRLRIIILLQPTLGGGRKVDIILDGIEEVLAKKIANLIVRVAVEANAGIKTVKKSRL
jgi:hypothetical protein